MHMPLEEGLGVNATGTSKEYSVEVSREEHTITSSLKSSSSE